jgi:hypothetical protein
MSVSDEGRKTELACAANAPGIHITSARRWARYHAEKAYFTIEWIVCKIKDPEIMPFIHISLTYAVRHKVTAKERDRERQGEREQIKRHKKEEIDG